jgi:isoamylase
VTWLSPEATELETAQWDDPRALCLGMLLDGRAKVSAIVRPGLDATVLMVFNAWHDAVNFTLPELAQGLQDDKPCESGTGWTLLVDTAVPVNQQLAEFDCGAEYLVTGRSMLVFLAAPKGGAATLLAGLERALLE